jgi:hypothetical protein
MLAVAIAAKLVIATANGVAVTDYPSMERCEKARAELLAQWQSEMQKGAPSNYRILVATPFHAMCIPG